MNNLRQAAQQALEVLENDAMQRTFAGGVRITNAAIALRAALAEPVQNEPLAWFRLDEKTNEAFLVYFPSADGKDWRPLYAMPRKPLTDEEIADLWEGQLFHITDLKLATDFVRDIERAHGIGEQK